MRLIALILSQISILLACDTWHEPYQAQNNYYQDANSNLLRLDEIDGGVLAEVVVIDNLYLNAPKELEIFYNEEVDNFYESDSGEDYYEHE